MVRTLTLLGLLLWMAHQAPGSDEYKAATRITTDPAEFGKGRSVTVSARFQQKPFVCPAGKEPTRLFAIKLYTADLVPTEPVWTEDVQATTPHYAYAISTVPPDEADSGKVVERTFYPLTIDKNMPERIYIVLWNSCTQVPRGGRMELRGDRVIAERYAGQFFRYSCPGTTKIPTGKCAYRPE